MNKWEVSERLWQLLIIEQVTLRSNDLPYGVKKYVEGNVEALRKAIKIVEVTDND